MEWSKLKNIILVILLVSNLFLLVLVAYRQVHSVRYLENARKNAVEILAQNGIAVELKDLPRDTSLALLTMERDKQQELQAAQALLGEVRETGLGGIVLYTGEKGTVRFTRSGEFSAKLNAGAYPLGEQTEGQHALEVLALFGFKGKVLSVRKEGERTLVTVLQSWQQVPVFLCRAVLVYQQGALIAIQEGESRRLIGPPQDTGSLRQMSVVTALLQFVEGLNELGDVCTALTSLEPGYTFSPGLSDPIVLNPVWYITTDTGAYYLEAGTGALRRAE